MRSTLARALRGPGPGPGQEKGRPLRVGLALSLERETGFEPATSTLARLHSTAELFPLNLGGGPPDGMQGTMWRRQPDLNRWMEVLQTSALPLGYAAPWGAGLKIFGEKTNLFGGLCGSRWLLPDSLILI